VWRHAGWQEDSTGASSIEEVLPMARLQGDEVRWALLETDGHAAWTLAEDGSERTHEVLGVYGQPVTHTEALGAAPWPRDGQHGSEPDRHLGVVHRGLRHHLSRDGMWMQPEPLLYEGFGTHAPLSPALLGPQYAAGRTNVFHDAGGKSPEAIALTVAAPEVGAAVAVTAAVVGVAQHNRREVNTSVANYNSSSGAEAVLWGMATVANVGTSLVSVPALANHTADFILGMVSTCSGSGNDTAGQSDDLEAPEGAQTPGAEPNVPDAPNRPAPTLDAENVPAEAARKQYEENKPGRKKQGRENLEKKKQGKKWTRNNPPREPPKHTPGKGHRKK
jgi:hypothetical protein